MLVYFCFLLIYHLRIFFLKNGTNACKSLLLPGCHVGRLFKSDIDGWCLVTSVTWLDTPSILA